MAKERRAAFVALSGAAIALAGELLVRRHPAAGHVALAVGVIAFAATARLPASAAAEAMPVETKGGSRAPLAGLVVLGGATLASIFGGSDGLVLGLWLTGFASLVTTLLVLCVRSARPSTVILLALSLLAAFFDCFRLEDFPPAVHGDVGEIALAALDMHFAADLFRPTAWWGIPGMHHAVQRIGLELAGGLAGARATDALLGALAVVPLTAIVWEAGGLVAAIATALLAIGSASMLNTWRSGLGLGAPPFLTLAALWAFSRAVRDDERSPRDFFLVVGIVAGLSVQVYLPARIVPLMVVGLAAHEILFGSKTGRSRVLRGFPWTVVCALAVAGPLLCSYARSPAALQPRSEKFIFSNIEPGRSLMAVLWDQAVRSVAMFHYYPDAENVGFFVGEGSFFEPLTAVVFLLGLAVGARAFRERRAGFPIVGWACGVMLIALTIHAPSYHRAGPAAVCALAVAGLGSAALLGAVENAAGAFVRAATARRIRLGSACLIGTIGIACGVRTYFFDYCRREWPLSDSTAVARRIAAEPAAGSYTYLLAQPAFGFGYGNIRFLAAGHRGRDLNPGDPPPTRGNLEHGVNLFIAMPNRAQELVNLAASLPPGAWERHYKMAPPGAIEMLVLRIEVP